MGGFFGGPRGGPGPWGPIWDHLGNFRKSTPGAPEGDPSPDGFSTKRGAPGPGDPSEGLRLEKLVSKYRKWPAQVLGGPSGGEIWFLFGAGGQIWGGAKSAEGTRNLGVPSEGETLLGRYPFLGGIPSWGERAQVRGFVQQATSFFSGPPSRCPLSRFLPTPDFASWTQTKSVSVHQLALLGLGKAI